MDCSDVEDLIVPYLMGAPDNDHDALKRHIRECEDCSQALTGEMIFDLASSVPQIAPPSGVRDRLFHMVELGCLWRNATLWASGYARRLRREAASGWIGAAAASLAITLVVSGVWFNDRLSEASRDAERFPEELAQVWEREGDAMAAAEDLREQTYELMRMSSVSDVSARNLVGVGLWASARGAVMVSYSSNSGSLLIVDLPPLPSDSVYQVWLIQGGMTYSAGWFTVDAAGYGRTAIIPIEPFDQFDGVGITIEPRGGSDSPTGATVLKGDL